MRATPSDLVRRALNAALDAMLIIDEAGIVRYASRQVSMPAVSGHVALHAVAQQACR
jgi:hypothetical protein